MALTKPRAYQIYDIDYKQAVRVVTISNITLAGGAPNSVDGVNLSLNDRVLVTGQTSAVQNGIYYVTTLGSGSTGTWTRSTDTDATGELLSGTIVMVTEGTAYADTQWKLITNDPITIGSTALTFVQNYLANSISFGATSFAIGSSNANATISVPGTSNVAVFATTGEYVTGLISASGNITAAGNVAGSNLLTGGLISATSNITSAANITGANLITSGIASAASFLGSIVSVSANVTGGNLLTAGTISGTGNATVGNISATIANFTTFNSSQGGSVTGTLIATSSNAQFFNQTNGAGYFTVAGYLSSVGNITSSANISGNYILGNGSQLTGLPATYANANVAAYLASGNDTSNIITTANVAGGNVLATTIVSGASHIGSIVSVTANVTSGNLLTGGLISATSNITSAANITGANLITSGITSAASFLGSIVSVSANITGGNLLTGGLISATSNITSAANVAGGNVLATTIVSGASHIGSIASLSGNVTGGNLLTAGIASVTGTITTAGGTNSTGFAVGNGAVSNVGLGFFPTAGTRGDYAIRDYSNVASTMYFDVGMGGTAAGDFRFRTTNAFSSVMIANSTGVYTPGVVSATGIVTGQELTSTLSSGDEGGQINLAKPATNSTLAGGIIIDVFQNRVRFFENGGTVRGAYVDITSTGAGVSTNLLAGSVAGSNTYVQFNDAGGFGGNGQFVYNKVTNIVTAGAFAGNTNGTGQNFQVGDDAWIGDINQADTMGVKGQQNPANGYIVFGNSDSTGKLGRAGTGPLTYAGAFSASGNVTGGNLLTAGLISATSTITGSSLLGSVVSASANITGGNLLTGGLISATSNITGGNLLTGGLISATSNITGANIAGSRLLIGSGNATAPGITFSADTSQDTGFYWISDGNIGVTTNGTLRVTFDNLGNVTATGNVTGGNLLTAGLISAASHIGSVVSVSGNITSAANVSGGNVLATTIVSGASHIGSIVSASGNVTGGNLITAGLVSTPTVIGTTVTVSSTGGLITLAPSSNISVSSKNINNLAQPVQDQDAATKLYVDNMVSTQLSYHQGVYAATTGTLETATGGTITYAQPNGAGNGVGATLTVAGGTFNLIDTANIQTANTRVLVKNQANSVLNGVYQWSNATVLTRTTDTDSYGPNSATDLSINDYFFVSNGNVNAGSAWIVDAPSGTITFGTSSITFAQFSSSQTYSANTQAGISFTGTVISAKTDNNTTAFDVGGNIIVKTGANLTTPNIGAATGTSLSATGNLTGGNINTGGLVTATGNIISTANVAGGNLIATTTVSGASLIGTIASVSGNVTGGNINTGGIVSAVGNIIAGADLFVGPGALTAGFTTAPIIVGRDTSSTYTQLAIQNASGAGSADITTYANNGTENQGWMDMGVTGNAFSDTNYTITGSNDGYLFAQGNASFGGNLVVATGNTGTTRDIVFGFGFLAANEFLRFQRSTNTVLPFANITANIGSTTRYLNNLYAASLLGTVVSVAGNITSAANVSGGNLLATTIVSGASHIGSIVSVTANVTGGNILTGGLISAAGSITTGGDHSLTGNIVDSGALSIITGSNGNIALLPNGTGIVTASGNISAVGNITGNYIFGNGSQLTGISAASSYGNANVAAYLASGTNSSNIITTANVSGGNVLATTIVSGASHIGTIVSVTANVTGGNLLTGGLISAAGNVTGGNIVTSGTGGNITGANVISATTFNGTTVSVTANITAAGNISGTYILGNGSQLTGLPATYGNTNVAAYLASGTNSSNIITTANVSGGNVLATTIVSGASHIGSIVSVTANITGGNLLTGGLISATSNITSAGNISGTYILGNGSQLTGISVASSYGNANVAAYLASGTNTSNVITTANVSGGNIVTSGTGGNITGANVISATTFNGTTVSVTGNITAAANIAGGNVLATTIVSGASHIGTIVSVTGNINGGNLIASGTISTAGNIVSTGSNGIANIGSATTYFNTVHAKATSAQYADVAEIYEADTRYAAGTVVEFGGLKEVTITKSNHSTKVSGVVSTNPAYIMNAGLSSDTSIQLALIGRVPCRVTGQIRKGDQLVSSDIPGVARAMDPARYQPGCVIGKALENYNLDDVGIIEVVVGRI